MPRSAVDEQARASLLQVLHSGARDLCAEQVEYREVFQPFQVEQSAIADLRLVELEPVEIGHSLQMREPRIRDVRAAEIDWRNSFSPSIWTNPWSVTFVPPK